VAEFGVGVPALLEWLYLSPLFQSIAYCINNNIDEHRPTVGLHVYDTIKHRVGGFFFKVSSFFTLSHCLAEALRKCTE